MGSLYESEEPSGSPSSFCISLLRGVTPCALADTHTHTPLLGACHVPQGTMHTRIPLQTLLHFYQTTRHPVIMTSITANVILFFLHPLALRPFLGLVFLNQVVPMLFIDTHWFFVVVVFVLACLQVLC